MAVKESAIERELYDRVLLRGGICVKVQALGQRGFFDRIIILPPGPRIIFAEIKRPRGGRLSIHQQRYVELFRRLGVAEVYIVKNSTDIDALLKT